MHVRINFIGLPTLHYMSPAQYSVGEEDSRVLESGSWPLRNDRTSTIDRSSVDLLDASRLLCVNTPLALSKHKPWTMSILN